MAVRRQVDVLFDLSDYPHGQPTVAAPAEVPRQPGSPSSADRDRRRNRFNAASLIRRLAISPREQRNEGWTPAQIVDHRTAMADARIALCAAMGNSLDDIDPASGYSMSQASYDNARDSWVRQIKYHGFNAAYDRARLREALAFWVERRPQYLDGDDWLAAGLAAHRDYWQTLNHPCGCPTCTDPSDDCTA